MAGYVRSSSLLSDYLVNPASQLFSANLFDYVLFLFIAVQP